MERESFEDTEVARILNEGFVSIKVDKEERPDIDSIYMRVCQALTGSGGWPTSIFMTAEQIPFFAGTYFPKNNFIKLLSSVKQSWKNNRDKLLSSGDEIISFINNEETYTQPADSNLTEKAYKLFSQSFDSIYGGFGKEPKFPTPHNLVFLLKYYQETHEAKALQMVERTLLQMYKGGIFDHIGYGFSRYSTDRYWLAPHFEKMLYDNALLSMAYLYAYEITEKVLYKEVALKIFEYVERELTHSHGGFFCAQDADSDGEEGKYYVFSPEEIISVLGKESGEPFNAYFDITPKGNFEGKSIPNLIKQQTFSNLFEPLLPKLYEYRKARTKLHKDIKILLSWNSLMIAALANGYRILGNTNCLKMAENAVGFIEGSLSNKNDLFVTITDRKGSGTGFLDDYAFYIFAQISLYEATLDKKYIIRARELLGSALDQFYDETSGGFFLYGKKNEQLIVKPKETYDGAIPSGNSVMHFNLTRLASYTHDHELYKLVEKHKKFMNQAASHYPAGYSFYLFSQYPTKDIVCVLKDKNDIKELKIKTGWVLRVLDEPSQEYSLINDKTTYYVCQHGSCLPPVNEI